MDSVLDKNQSKWSIESNMIFIATNFNIFGALLFMLSSIRKSQSHRSFFSRKHVLAMF